MSQGPLASLKVVEFSGLGPAPLAGQLLADMGAEVITVDRAAAPADPTDINRRGKKSIVLNLKTDAGLDAARRLTCARLACWMRLRIIGSSGSGRFIARLLAFAVRYVSVLECCDTSILTYGARSLHYPARDSSILKHDCHEIST